jgi:putative glutamine amidotransferase
MKPEPAHRPRVGVPYRTKNEQDTNRREKYDYYLQAVRQAGGDAVEIGLDPESPEFRSKLPSLDAIVLPGSPADVNPIRYHAKPHEKAAAPDKAREDTDFALLDYAFAQHKPALAICYGNQLLNVYRHGSLIQHISSKDPSSEVKTSIPHPSSEQHDKSFRHSIGIAPGSRLAGLAGAREARVNSSHHQAIREVGEGLRVTAHSEDGVIEAVEWTGDDNWVMGVQWHPERMPGDPLAESLFHALIEAARRVPVRA